MKKKIISIIIAVALVVSMMTVAMVSASARIDINGRYTPANSDSTYRYYFYMPTDWENSFTKSTIAGVYMLKMTDIGQPDTDLDPELYTWPGAIAQYDGTYAEGSVYYADCPTDIECLLWNNYVNGGTYENGVYQYSEEQYKAAKQTIDIWGLDDAETYSNYELYPDGLESFNNMIYVLDPSKVIKNELSGKETYAGEWYYYYGDGKYGIQPTLEEAEATDTVLNTSYQPPKPDSSPQQPGNNNYDKSIKFDVLSANWGSGVKAVYCHIYNYAGTDGKTYTAWQTKSEKCEYDSSTGIATYYLKTGIDKGANGLETIDNSNKWVIMFSCNTGAETYSLVFNSDCFGNTIIADPDVKYEHPLDSEKKSIKIYYNNNINLTAPKCITSTGKVQGETFADGCTNETLLGDYLATYALDDTKVNKEIVSELANELGIHPSDAYDYAIETIDMDNTNYPGYTQKKLAINAVKTVIDSIPKAIIGDVNGDGKLGIDDATDIQKYIVEIYDFSDYQKKLSDVNKDGKIDVDDVTLIQKSLVGLAVIE